MLLPGSMDASMKLSSFREVIPSRSVMSLGVSYQYLNVYWWYYEHENGKRKIQNKISIEKSPLNYYLPWTELQVDVYLLLLPNCSWGL